MILSDERKRIINQAEDPALSAGDFIIVDSQSEGTRKFDLGTELTSIKQDLANVSGLSDDAKEALLACFRHIAFLDDDDDYYQDLYDALYPPAPPKTLVSISAVYTQSGTVYETDTLESLKSDLVVTALYDDTTTATVTTYTLSGTLEAGTSTITVTYGGKTATFNVTVSASRLPSGYTEYDYITITKTGGLSGYGIIADVSNGSDYVFETKIKYTEDSVTSPTPMFGTRTSGAYQKQFALFVTPSTGKLGYWVYGTDTTQAYTPFAKDTLYDIKVQPKGVSETYPNNVTFIINGTEYNSGSTVSGATYADYLALFNYASSATTKGGTPSYIGLQIGETIIKDLNDNVIADLIPCSNGTYYGFYDAIGEEFYYDASHSANYTGGNWEV